MPLLLLLRLLSSSSSPWDCNNNIVVSVNSAILCVFAMEEEEETPILRDKPHKETFGFSPLPYLPSSFFSSCSTDDEAAEGEEGQERKRCLHASATQRSQAACKMFTISIDEGGGHFLNATEPAALGIKK